MLKGLFFLIKVIVQDIILLSRSSYSLSFLTFYKAYWSISSKGSISSYASFLILSISLFTHNEKGLKAFQKTQKVLHFYFKLKWFKHIIPLCKVGI